ncbi:MAG: DUF5696 domain-containing protein [Clostridia bacterium]|nr:DUF5696 domain-containing protein [Clostridia bacterium]
MKFLRAIIKVVCLILVVGLIMTAVFFRNNGVNTITPKNVDIRAEAVSADISDKKYKKIAESGYLQLLFDKDTTAIAIKETSGKKKWYSNPKGTESSIAEMVVKSEKGTHYLNSQSNSVAFGSFSTTTSNDGVTLRYIMADDEATAKKEKFSENDVAFAVTVDFKLKDGNFSVDASYENLTKNKNCAVTNFSVLPYFGAFNKAEKGDFLLIPDGCGAIVHPYYEKSENTYECSVYGNDISLEQKSTARAIMGAFGMKSGDNSYAAIIDSSSEYAKIKAVSSKDGYSRVFADFAFDYTSEKGKKLNIYHNNNRSVSILYKFLSRGSATYSDIASACREQFIRNGTLSVSSIASGEDVPMTLELTGAYKEKRWSIKTDEYTTFSQAEDIIKRVKAKGINNLSVRYNGIFLNNSTELNPLLGGKSGFESLASYVESQNVNFFAGVDVLTYESAFSKYDFLSARAMNKFPFMASVENSLGQQKNLNYRTLKKSNRFIDSIIEKADDYKITGFSVNDAGKLLSSDFSHSGAKRTDYKNSIISQLSALSHSGKTMVDAGNIYTVLGSYSLVNVPISVSYEESDVYTKIPFVQEVLHGMTILSSTPINTAENALEAELQCIEYGLCPTFSVVYSKPEGSKLAVEFDSSANDIVSTYNTISQALHSLESERITNHSKVKNGVYCTTYSNSARVYVNYNDTEVTVNGVTVPQKGFIRIG